MTDFSKTLIRCHAIGAIMTETSGKTNLDRYNDVFSLLKEEEAKYDLMPKKEMVSAVKKKEKIDKLTGQLEEMYSTRNDITLSDTCKTHLIQTYVLSKYNRVREVQTKQMVKGTISEDDAIALFSSVDRNIYKKNPFRLSNEFISGVPDLHDGENIMECTEIIDIKSCWDIFTFLSNVAKPENSNYYWQLQGYMMLTGAKIGTIAYCLVNTPDSIIEGEKYNLLRRMDLVSEEAPEFQNEFAKLWANRKFDDIPMEERLLTYSIDRNDEDIEAICKKVVKCREFLSEFEETHLKFSKNNRKIVDFV